MAEAATAAAEGGKTECPMAAMTEAEAAAGAVERSRAGGWKGPLIKQAPSWASRASLANEGFFGGWPRRPLKFTDLPPTVQPVMAESPAVEESIEEGGGEVKERALEINNRVNVLVGCGERE
jgi:hypothetical protein